jgi:uncharacterized membrane protein YidH (DUF202 family)
MSGHQYDEPGSRTRQAWLRTSLGVMAVTALVVRGMVLQGVPGSLVLASILPAAAFLAVAVVRTRILAPGESEALRSSAALVTSAAALGLALVAGVSVLAFA